MIEFEFQKNCIETIERHVSNGNKSILVEGMPGCGKTTIVKHIAAKHNIHCVSISPTVDEVRDAVQSCSELTENVWVIIENLDVGSQSSANAILKFLEEPKSNIQVIVTCRNANNVPHTIVSRSIHCVVGYPNESDLCEYAKSVDAFKFSKLYSSKVWNLIKSLKDVDEFMSMQDSYIEYYEKDVPDILKFKGSVSDISWKLGHYPDNAECNIKYVLRAAVNNIRTQEGKLLCIQCAEDVDKGRVSKHAVLAKLAFEGKYGI